MKQTLRAAALVAVLGLGATAVSAQQPLRIAELSIAYSAITHVADMFGFVKTSGAPVTIMPVQAGPNATAQLRSPSGAELATIAVTPVVSLVGAGQEPIILATTITSNSQVRLVTYEKNGITSDPKTLRGKKIGRVRNTVGEIYLSRLLDRASLKASDVTLVDGLPSDLVNLLVSGAIDAAALWDPFVVTAERHYRAQLDKKAVPDRGKALVFVDKTLYTLAFNVVTTREKLKGNEEAVKNYLRALIKAEEVFAESPSEAQAKLESWLNLQSGDLGHFMRTTRFKVELDVAQMKTWLDEEMTWLKSVQDVKSSPTDMSRFIDASLLQSVDSSRVR